MKIVKFKDGKYGVRQWSLFDFGYLFLDLNSPKFWWGPDKHFFRNDCRGTLDEVREAIRRHENMKSADLGEPIDDN